MFDLIFGFFTNNYVLVFFIFTSCIGIIFYKFAVIYQWTKVVWIRNWEVEYFYCLWSAKEVNTLFDENLIKKNTLYHYRIIKKIEHDIKLEDVYWDTKIFYMDYNWNLVSDYEISRQKNESHWHKKTIVDIINLVNSESPRVF